MKTECMTRFHLICLSLFLTSATQLSAQTRFFFHGGSTRTILFTNKNNNLLHTEGRFGLTGTIGVEKMLQQHTLSLEIGFGKQPYREKVGPLYFPDDSPLGPGSFFSTQRTVKNLTVLPAFNYYLLKGRFYLPVGIGIHKTFTTDAVELIRQDTAYTVSNVFYKVPGFNVSFNTGMHLLLGDPGKKPVCFAALRYSLQFIRIKPEYNTYKKISLSALALSVGIKI